MLKLGVKMSNARPDQNSYIKKAITKLIFLFLLVIIAMLANWWWRSSMSKQVELTYCGLGKNYGTPQYKCIEVKLRIPQIYYEYYPIVGSEQMAKERQELEVAYPSMKPWQSLPFWERWNADKIFLIIDGATSQTVQDAITIYFLGTPKPSRVPGSIYGLDQYLYEPGEDWQFLIPLEAKPRIFIRCAYSIRSPDERGFGCIDTTYSPWGLKLTLHHKRILLPHWADIHAKVQALIQTFVVTP